MTISFVTAAVAFLLVPAQWTLTSVVAAGGVVVLSAPVAAMLTRRFGFAHSAWLRRCGAAP
jgi:hypothetical protein